MNTKEALKELRKMLGEFPAHPRFIDEVFSLLKKQLKGKESRFFNILVTQLKNIRDFGIMVHTIDSNEKIHGGDGHFYSIHLKQSQFNIRFIVYIFDDGTAYLLTAFYERSGKKVSDYTNHIPVLAARLEELKGSDKHE